jgi:hypothetical protein
LKHTLTFITLFYTAAGTQTTFDEESEETPQREEPLKKATVEQDEEAISVDENEETSHQQEQLKTATLEGQEASEDDESTRDVQEDNIKPCRHEDLGEFKEIERSYFTPEYLEKNEFAVRACATCKKNFGTTPSFTTTFAVTAKNTVLSCANASISENQCMHALCKLCHETQRLALIDTQPSSATTRCCRKRKVRSITHY